MVAIVLAGEWNQLSLVQAVLQDCKTESSLFLEHIYTGNTRCGKYSGLFLLLCLMLHIFIV